MLDNKGRKELMFWEHLDLNPGVCNMGFVIKRETFVFKIKPLKAFFDEA